MKIRIHTLAAFSLLTCLQACDAPQLRADAPAAPWSENAGAVVLNGANSNFLRVQALGDDVVRVWAKPVLDFHRDPSNALLTPIAPSSMLRTQASGASLLVKTADVLLRIDRSTLDFSMETPVGGHPILDAADIAWNVQGGWTLKYSLKPDEHLLGMGQDNYNGGPLDRRGTVRDMWTGQQINSGNVTANYPVPLLLSTGYQGRAYGIFIDDIHRMHLDLGATDKSTFRCDAEGGEADF